VLVGDGAGAAVIETVEGESDLLSWNLNADGSLKHLLYCEHGGFLVMDGKEIFRKAVRVVVESARRPWPMPASGSTTSACSCPPGQPAHHQAACQRLGISEEKSAIVIDRYGNTSSASIPLALVDAIDNGRVKPGDTLLLSGFGGGMTWASAVLRWGG